MPAKVKAKTRFLSSQARWIQDESRLKLMEKSRQTGISWGTAYANTRAASVVPQEIWVTSRDDIQARLYLEDCANWAKLLHRAAKNLGEQVIDEKTGAKAYVLEFANGSRIHSMSSNPDAQAGKRGSRVLDEFALHPDQRKLWAIAYPGITWGGSLSVISTHRGSTSLFNLLIQEAREGGNPKKISLHRITLQDALDEGFLDKLQSKLPKDDPRQEMDEADYFDFVRSGCVDEESFQQEYMCNPADDITAFINYALIDAATMQPGEDWEKPLDPRGVYYLGVDIGRKKDLTCLYLVEADGDRRITRRVVTMERAPFEEQAAAIEAFAALPWVHRVCIDATGIGAQLAETARVHHGPKVEEIQFTTPAKESMAVTLKRAFQDGALRIPNDRKLIADIRKIKQYPTTGAHFRYEGERDADGHADRFWALALAIYASTRPAGVMHFGVLGPAQRVRRAVARTLQRSLFNTNIFSD